MSDLRDLDTWMDIPRSAEEEKEEEEEEEEELVVAGVRVRGRILIPQETL